MSATQTVTQEATASGFPLNSKPERSHATIDELIRHRAEELNDFPLIGYPRNGLIDFEEHGARALDRYVDAAVLRFQNLGLNPVDSSLEKAPVVSILAQSSFNVIVTLLGLSRMGYAVFFLSTRLAAPALLQLLEMSECNTVVTQEAFHPVLAEVQQKRSLALFPVLVREDYFVTDAPVFLRSYDARKETEKIGFIIHSSGSTGLPKPIFLSHRNCIGVFGSNLGMNALLTSPLFHSHGLYEVFRSIYSKKTIYLRNYALPLTNQGVISMVRYVQPELLHCVPYVLKLFAESEEGVRCLAQIKTVLFAGSSCPDDLGDRLVKNGVNLCANYGATETGRLMTSARPPGDNYWNYLRVLPPVKQYVWMDEIAPGVYECVALDGLTSKSTVNSQDPPNSFRTRDLFTPHPEHVNMWRYLSRLDDRLTLVNGEKVLPIPIEGKIRTENYVKEVAVFGAERSVPGLLLFRAESASHLSDEGFIEAVWPVVEAANAQAETFSRIPKELVVVVPFETNYPQTDKGTFIRAQLYNQFKPEIDAAYEKFENGEAGTLIMEVPELEHYLLRKFREDLGVDLKSREVDFFAFGIDSLQCIKLWNIIKSQLDLGGRQAQLSQNILYEKGNVAELARYLVNLRTGDLEAIENQFQVMRNLITKYSSFQQRSPGKQPRPEKETILVSGTTGALGAHILAQLVRLPNVEAIWAPVRAKTCADATERVATSLKSRGLEISSEEQSKIVALPSDFSQANFGFDDAALSELRSKLTIVIHSAWAVNFNISVQSFEGQHISAVHNLIQFCLDTDTPEPARFYFCSSVSSAGGTPKPAVVPEGPVKDISFAQKTGYARSKYVAEHIVLNAAKVAHAPARVLRVGQLVGDTKQGVWNTTEGIPLMIQTAETLGALPALDEEMTWLPVDVAAEIILELTDAISSDPSRETSAQSSEKDLVYHVLNPTRFHWTRDMLPALAAAGLKFETLSSSAWLERLRSSSRDPVKNPPIKLFDWFEGKYGGDQSKIPAGVLEYLTEETGKKSTAIRNVPDVTRNEFITKIIESLQRRWHNTATAS